ncbi:MAG: SUMF1/EgtB/PvdO family nonheme iron enzyme [Polyangiaceae bacterium]
MTRFASLSLALTRFASLSLALSRFASRSLALNRFVSLSLALLLPACGEESLPAQGHVLLHVTTDAPLPAAIDEADDLDQAPLFDRLQIDVFPVGQTQPCAGCSRQVAADRSRLADASFALQGGVADIRLRLYRSAGSNSGAPRARSTIDRTVRIAPPAEGRVDAHVVLKTDDVGLPNAMVAVADGGPPAGVVGSWPGASVTPCSAPTRDDDACIPGGAQWLGDPNLDTTGFPEKDGAHERLVVLAPYFLDLKEVTVSEFRASGLATALILGGPSDNPREKDHGIVGCVYTTQTSDSDTLPVNCLSWSKAKQYCESLGKRLPTEAEYERAASALGRSRFVWGSDLPSCEDAVQDREGLDAECASLGAGPAPAGSGLRDVLDRDGKRIVDLMGNVNEWAADRWNRDDEGCWSSPLILVNPSCDAVSATDGNARVFRGGDYGSSGLLLHASLRGFVIDENFAVDAHLGFRCARGGN